MLRSYRDGGVISASQIDPQMKMAYDVPYLAISRADLAQILYGKTQTHGVQTYFGAQITEIGLMCPSIKLASGELFNCDLFLGADGLHSTCRVLIPGQAQQPFFSGDVIFHIILSRFDLQKSKDMIELTQNPVVHIFMGPNAHVVLYPLKVCELYNIVLLLAGKNLPKEILEDRYDSTGDKRRLEWLRTRFGTWSEEIKAVLAIASGATVWRLEYCQ
ncbi:hypothetical protein MMC34_006764 [Xylographa carneopallida]|nr:hypothetical protein [Xylographa carneopallida]